VASAAALKALLAALQAEQERRGQLRGQPSGDVRERLHRELDQMAERLRAAPGYVPPTPEQRALARQDLERFFRDFRARTKKSG
jgi:hypothetical protein